MTRPELSLFESSNGLFPRQVIGYQKNVKIFMLHKMFSLQSHRHRSDSLRSSMRDHTVIVASRDARLSMLKRWTRDIVGAFRLNALNFPQTLEEQFGATP